MARKTRGKSTSQRIKENQDAHAHMFRLVWEVDPSEFERTQFTYSTFKKDGKHYVVGYTAHDPGQLRFVAKSRGWQNYKILYTKGAKTPLKNGEWYAN